MVTDGLETVALFLRFGLAFVFLTAAVPKLLARGDFERALRNYGLLPGALVRPVAIWLPWAELTCALALFAGVALTAVGSAAAVVLAVFTAAIAVNLLRGRRIECGCYSLAAPRRIGWGLIARDLALLAGAVVVAVAAPERITSSDTVAALVAGGSVVVGELLVEEWLRARRVAQRYRIRAGELAT
jgi:hypothetical protein